MKSTIGKNIRQFRRAADMSAEQLGEVVGVTSSAIYQYEKGVNEPPLETIEKIAVALKVKREDLLGLSMQKENSSFDNPLRDPYIQQLKQENQRLLWMLDKYMPGIATVGANFKIAGVKASGKNIKYDFARHSRVNAA